MDAASIEAPVNRSRNTGVFLVEYNLFRDWMCRPPATTERMQQNNLGSQNLICPPEHSTASESPGISGLQEAVSAAFAVNIRPAADTALSTFSVSPKLFLGRNGARR